MNEGERPNLTEGWPADPGNEGLAGFAAELHAVLPALPTEALARVEQKVRAELAPQPSARGRRWLRLAAAASLLLALGVGGYFWLRPREAAPPGPVEDRYTVEFAPPRAPLRPQPPLVRLDEYQTLFAD
jgi:hypothetical protein